MSTQQNFDGKIVTIPGVYSNIKSGLKNVPQTLDYGHLLIIDTGSGAGAGGGSGINGSIINGFDAMYEFDNIEDYQDFLENGNWWLMAPPLFKPNGFDSIGVSKITHIKAATTVEAKMTFAPQGADSSDSQGGGGSLVIQVRSEGIIGNGVLNTANELSRGCAFKVVAGTKDTSKSIIKFYRGTYRGLDQNGLPMDGVTEALSKPELICQSKEFYYLSELIAWMQNSTIFNKYFRYDSVNSSISGDGYVDAADRVTYTNYTLATGGTETYGAQDLIDAYEIIKNLPCDFIFCDNWGAQSQSANNISIVDFATNYSKFKPQVYIASGTNKANFQTSKDDAAFYDNQQVTIVHGGCKVPSTTIGTGFRIYDSYMTTAYAIGREAGIQAQIPLTFKNIGIAGLTHPMIDKEKEEALSAGVLVFVNDSGNFECLKGVNSLQDNDNPLAANGTTHSKQLYRIAHQLNKELIITAKRELLKNPNGTNRNTLGERDVESWTKNFLIRKTADPLKDNLILSFRDVQTTRTTDAYKTNYTFGANTEIGFLFFTGFMEI